MLCRRCPTTGRITSPQPAEDDDPSRAILGTIGRINGVSAAAVNVTPAIGRRGRPLRALRAQTENQLQEVRRYVEARGWTATEYVDKGVSGAKERRPPLDRLV